jgi:CheY-like chemotaxis protein
MGTEGTKKILIVDDDKDFRSTVNEVLTSQGYLVLEATSGKAGLEKVLSEKPDLIILDIMMEHEWAGYEINQAIKFGDDSKGIQHIPIIMVSSIQTDPMTQFAYSSEAGMVTPNAYLTKPIDLESFLEKVRSFIG